MTSVTLWIDRPDCLQVLCDKWRSGIISEDLAAKLAFFIQNGFVILREAVPQTETAKIRADIDHFWSNPDPGALCETYELESSDGPRNVRPQGDLKRGSSTLLDYYAFSRRLRRAMSSPQLMEFLWAVFEEQPKAFQSLTFWKASEAPMHRDTAYVRMPRGPSFMVGTWLALENVQRGSGEIELLAGSHRYPDYLFGGHSKWLADGRDELPQFLSWFDGARDRHRVERFLGSEGDCLIWHADMVHSGSKITKAGVSRQSHVAHYTADSVNPPYMDQGHRAVLSENGLSFTSEFALSGFLDVEMVPEVSGACG